MFQRRVGEGSLTGLNVLRADLLRNLFQGLTHLALVFRALPTKPHHRAAYETELDISPNLAHCEEEQLAFFSRAAAPLFLFVGADFTACKHIPRNQGQAFSRVSSSQALRMYLYSSPSESAIGIMSRSKSRCMTFQDPW